MRYSSAFYSLGYSLENRRQDWTAIKEGGVCITLWTKELGRENQLPYFDEWELHPAGSEFQKKAGHKKRTQHLKQALEKYHGFVDVILVNGAPGISYGDAEPWDIKKRGGGWFISKFDPESGYFRAEIRPIEKV